MALTEPTSVPFSSALIVSKLDPSVAKSKTMLVTLLPNAMVRGMLLASAGPGSSRTCPVSVEKNVENTTKPPPGSLGLLNVADSPSFTSVNVVAVPTASVSKLKMGS